MFCKSTANAIGKSVKTLFAPRWEKLTSDPVILEFVKGVKIEFLSGVTPTKLTGRNSHYSAKEQATVQCELKNYYRKTLSSLQHKKSENLSLLPSCEARIMGHIVQY